MITFAPVSQTLRRERLHLPWLPLILFTLAALLLTANASGWVRMWLIAIALFAGFKWWTLRRVIEASAGATNTPVARAICCPGARSAQEATQARSLAYLCLWPGMSVRAFLFGTSPAKPALKQWLWALTKTLLGATLLWVCARQAGHGLLAGWIGMVGFIFLLHFGLFALLSLFWQSHVIDAPPLMKCPIAATSLHDFWGRRWNAGFRDIVFALFFYPLARRLGVTAAALATFVLSGLIHELVITVPAGADYGLPTFYFALQGAGLMLERSSLGAALGLTHGWRGRAFALGTVTLPIGALFPPVFVTGVMVPFFQLIHAL